jgi:hypothetical protein
LVIDYRFVIGNSKRSSAGRLGGYKAGKPVGWKDRKLLD